MRLVHLLLLVLVLAAGSSFATPATQKKPHPQKKQQPTAPAITDAVVDSIPPQPPPPPPTPEQGPSSPPEVSYQAGQLVIVARNSTMGDVLNAVKQKTGASVEMPPSSTERVVGRFGPGAPRDVMAQLLNGSHYDYVLLGSPADPGALKKVVLLARVSGPQPNAPQPQQAQQMQPGYNGAVRNNVYQNLQAVPEVENDQQVDEPASDTSQDVQPPEEEQPPTADQAPADQSQPGQQPMVKTPEQLLRELQQQQQQQQQDQNGQPAPPQQPPQ